MRYVYKFASIDFNINSLIKWLEESKDFIPDSNSQQQLFNQNEDFVNINEDIAIYNQDVSMFINKNNQIELILTNFTDCFEYLAAKLRNMIDERTSYSDKKRITYPVPSVDYEVRQEEINDYIDDTSYQIAGDFYFNKDQFIKFIKFLIEKEEIKELLSEYIDSNYKNINIQKIVEYNNYIINYHELDNNSKEELNELTNSEQENSDEKYKSILDFYYDNNLCILPDWIPEKILLEFTHNNSSNNPIRELIQLWYKDTYYNSLKESADEYLYSSAEESIKDQCFEIEHRYGFNPFIIFPKKYEKNNIEDYRNQMTVDALLETMKELNKDFGYFCNYIHTCFDFIYLRIANIKNIIIKNNLQSLLKDNIQIDEQQLIKIVDKYENNINFLPENFMSNSLEEYFKNRNIVKEKNKLKLQNTSKTTTKEELENLKKLNITKNPFEYTYSFAPGKFPGAGAWRMENMQPFSIAIYPEINGFPDEILDDLNLHTVQGEHYLGWIGGFADVVSDIMYVNEIQSDIMQRTGKLSTKENHLEEIKKNISKLETELNALNNKPLYDPREILLNKINKIEQEQLTATNQVREKNKITLQKLYNQLNNIKDNQTKNNELKKQKITFNIQKLQNELKDTELNKKDAFYNRDIQEKYYPYKNKIEKQFKDWYALFFNTALKEAKNRGFKEVRLISANQLMKTWSRHVSPDTLILFEKIYDNTAKKYNAIPVSALSYNWWSIEINDNTKIAKLNDKSSQYLQRRI